jgi:lysyl-tRNA synthetase class 2
MHQINDLIKQRLENLKALKDAGVEPYGGRFDTTSSVEGALKDFKEGKECVLAGRIMAIRLHGKSAFCDLKDRTGKIQFYVNEKTVGSENFALFKLFDLGDIIGIKGELFKTRTGEMTAKVSAFTLLSKSLRPLPEKWHGLKDVETRYRQRYLDLIANDEVKKVFRSRSRIISEIRNFLDGKGYLEVETPMMQAIPGGAAGKPFKTHHNALDMDLYLRIAPEIYLKKLLVGGLEKVYEINRNFRNEGISPRHNPEFTMLEVYTAYSNCEGTMRLTEELIKHVSEKVLGRMRFSYGGREVDLTRWEKVSFAQLMKDEFGIEPDDSESDWITKIRAKGINIEGKELSRTQLINIVGELVEPKTGSHPVFVVDIFTELCPLAKTKKENPLLTDRFELYMGGMEVANAYSELNDPIEQKKRFERELEESKEKREIDNDFIRSLEHGMPPAGGLGIGIDRLVMILTDSASIRDVILFPQLRKEVS